jgi:dTDP-4-dehydrorhamnose 3,5-epimerase
LLSGRAIDICVNIDKKSKNFGKVYKFKLKPGLLLLIPKNFAHGIGFYEKKNILLYHLSEYRSEKTEGGILYNDKTLNIKWGIKKPILSKRDKNHPPFNKI